MMSRVCAAVMMLLLSGGAAAQNDTDIIFKINEEGYFQRIKLEPGACDESHQYCIEVPKVVEGETVKSLTEKFRTRYSHFSEGWIEYISYDIGKKFDAYMKAKEMGIIAIGNSFTTSAFSFGTVVDNFYGLDYLTNKFKVDMKIYIREIEETTNKTLEEVKDEAYTNKTAVVEHQGKDGEKYIELLSKPWEEVNFLPRYKNAVPVRNTFCSDKYHEKMRVISEAKYKEKFGGEGVQIQHSTAAPSVILDSDKNILYLKANGVQITFDAPNGRFFPLQSNILDIKLYLPRSREFDRAVICIDPHFTGFHLPMESASRIRTNVPFLSMVPRITGERAPPYLGTHHSQMRNKYLEDDPEDQIEGAKMVESATFTLIYIPEYWGGFAMMLPFIFIIIATLLQWLVHNPDKFSNSQMITAILQLQSVVSAQKGYMQSDNKMTNVIFLTYGIIISNILTIALMAYINTCKEKGRSPTLVRLKESIFRMLRLFDILLALFLIPVLAVKTDNLTGEQVDYPFTWYIVGFTTFFLIAFRGFKEYRKYKKSIAHSMEEEASEKADVEELARMSSLSPDSTWTSEQVGQWIGNSELVRDSSALTEGELLGIASKFVEADVNGIVFPMVAYDADVLKRDVNLTVGEAFLFVHTMQKLSAPPDEEKETTNAAFAEAVLVK